MLDTIEVAKLEKLYAKRQTKQLLKYLLVCFFAIALLATAIFYSFDDATKNSSIELAKNEQNKKEQQEYASAKPDTYIKDNEEDIKKAQKQALKEKARAKIKEEETMLAEIDLSGYFNEVPESAISKEPLYRTQIEEPEYSSTNSTPASVKSTEIQPNYNNKSSKNNIKISSAPINPKLESIEEHFKNSKDPKDALALARDYYAKKDYKNAAKWAFELNNLDKKNADGWLIFAKSKYNVGNKKDALKVLEAYLSQASNKEEVQNLITKMQSNIPLSE